MSHDPHNLDGFHGQSAGSHDESMDDWYADGYAAEREAARTAKFRVTFDVEYDPESVIPIEFWKLEADLHEFLSEGGRENIAVTDVKVGERITTVEQYLARSEGEPND